MNQLEINTREITVQSALDTAGLELLKKSPQSVKEIRFHNMESISSETFRIVNEFLKERKSISMRFRKPEELTRLPELEHIGFTNFTNEAITALRTVKKIRTLDLGALEFTNITSIEEFKEDLVELKFVGKISRKSEEALGRLVKLKYLRVRSTMFSSFEFLKNLKRLTVDRNRTWSDFTF